MKAVILLSGGMDSATLIGHCIDNDIKPYCLNINYGQRHNREIKSAEKLAKYYNISLKKLDLSPLKILLKGSALTDKIDVPEGHYTQENMKLTVVPNRNAILLSIAVGYAISIKADFVMLGAHAGDHDIYPDCREEFLDPFETAILRGNYHQVKIITPFLKETKVEILQHGIKYGTPYGLTWTCYKGGKKACGKCGSCNERLEAIEQNRIKDPLEYENE